MPPRPTSSTAVKKLMIAAGAFALRHTGDPATRRSFGYFTRHPVAPLNQRRLELLLRAIAPAQGKPLRILDVACGGGIVTCALAALGHRVVGVDLDPEEIRLARLFASEEKLEGVFLQADVLADGWESRAEETLGGRPDVVTLAYALHHLPEPGRLCARLSAWLAPGALLVVNEENPRSPLFRLKHRVRGWIQRDTQAEWHRSLAAWKELLASHGFHATGGAQGTDLVPGLGRLLPERSWSVVFTARRR